MNVSTGLKPRVAAVMGALIADSAALGLHWLYDPERIAQIEQNKGLVFLQPQKDHYADAEGFFAHGSKTVGDASGYGEVCLLMLRHLAAHGEFNRVEFQSEYRNHFGPGGTYTGYIDTPTRLTLLKLISLTPQTYPEASGADDDQFAALATVPVITAAHHGTLDALLQKIEIAVRLTNDNETAVAAAKYAAAVLNNILSGNPIEAALTVSLQYSGEKLAPLLEEAIHIKSLNSVTTAARFGSACHVNEGLPVIAHIARHAENYQQAVEANIRAGGDSCGRAIVLGAVSAAQATMQCDGDSAIPLSWLAKYNKLSIAAEACARL
ncbi:ADP-ribosylglycohydrolase family protein [Nitrosomonas marina]|uniref:ADP-ribosylglycohydrolase n=1 Tax=Nitrosomonas marina TaxID=917 RepID=A0A1H8CR53_9PROT|nr:ADP-ribosylglycohydrolase family protein [Nitrosomonas marina]SEM97711.1 ADP-ribosylglycohydrolase [Nitrosomonas marina]